MGRLARLTGLLAVVPLAGAVPLPAGAGPGADGRVAERFAGLALACIEREYPNKISHVLHSDDDVAPARELTPVFYGCFDWHSAVHGHWLLVRLARSHAGSELAERAMSAVARNVTEVGVSQEVRYLGGPGRASFERPYGLAWLLQLAAELGEWNDPRAQALSKTLTPLERAAAARLRAWLPKLTYPIRAGEHSQTAFAFGLALDWARARGDAPMASLLERRIAELYAGDRDCPLAYEPSGQDFLSPCLAEADLMRRVLEPSAYAAWLGAFLPGIPLDGSDGWLPPAVVTDRADPKLAHLDGLNLSRAWMIEGIASGLPEDDPRRAALVGATTAHRDAGLASVTGEHYEGGHWLGSFATYLVTRRGLVPTD